MVEGREPLEAPAGPPRGRLALIVLVVTILVLSFWPYAAPTSRVSHPDPAPVLPLPTEVARTDREAASAEATSDGHVLVRVVDPGGAPLAGVAVTATIRGPRGATLFEAIEDSGDGGRATFRGLADFARSFEAGSTLELRFVAALPGSLRFGARSLPSRELVLVRDEPSARGTDRQDEVPEKVATLPPAVVSEPPSEPPSMPAKSAASTPTDFAADSSRGLPSGGTELVREPDSVATSTTLPGTASQASVAQPADPGSPRRVLLPGSLVGRLRLDPSIPARELQLELDEVLPGEAGRLGRRLGPLVPDESGAFRFDGVAPGLCALRVSLFGSPGALAWIDELEVEPNDVLRDARLAPFDLSGRLGSLEVELFDDAGRRLELAVVAPLDKRNGTLGSLRQQRVGATPRVYFDRRALAGQGGLDLALEAPGFAPREVHAAAEELTSGAPLRFRMERRRAAALELRLVEAPRPGVELEARLERPDGQRRPWDFERHRGVLDALGRLRLEPAETGAFVVRLALREGGAWRQLELSVPVEVLAFEGTPTATDMSGEDVQVVFVPLGSAQL